MKPHARPLLANAILAIAALGSTGCVHFDWDGLEARADASHDHADSTAPDTLDAFAPDIADASASETIDAADTPASLDVLDTGAPDIADIADVTDAVDACTSPMTACGGSCVDTRSDVANCGTCGHVCTATTSGAVASCESSVCVERCGAGLFRQNSACVSDHSCPTSSERGCGMIDVNGGVFAMGDPAVGASRPVQMNITVSDYVLDASEVTVARFRRFWSMRSSITLPAFVTYPNGVTIDVNPGTALIAPIATSANTGCNYSDALGSREAHPVNCVDWYTAMAFCVWDGGRLPTEAEYEFVARARDVTGLAASPRDYPWGGTAPDHYTCTRAQYTPEPGGTGAGCPGDDGAPTRRVASFAGTGGFYDLSGNVEEWSADFWGTYMITDAGMECWPGTPRTDPLCTAALAGNPSYRTRRGGAYDSHWYDMSSAERTLVSPGDRGTMNGFRCARVR